MRNQSGFTMIELVVVIVILGILAVVAIPKFVDMRVEAEKAQANGVYGAAQAAAALNHAAKLVGKAAADRPAHDGASCTSGLVNSGACLLAALEDTPQGWAVDGSDASSISTTINTHTYTITVQSVEDDDSKAVLTKTGF